jgi:hypothetical protein
MVPYIQKDLLEYLQTAFPNKLPDAPISQEELGVLIGGQRVINFLAHHFKLQAVLASKQTKD